MLPAQSMATTQFLPLRPTCPPPLQPTCTPPLQPTCPSPLASRKFRVCGRLHRCHLDGAES
ncbi:uncharacterized protein SCHCODRAFT_02603939 [Schizophyllum commune H4-8]|uniref:uncharacterized protein n=1 Tax=Schizophyllum commune (strain H4-8 / FGSC 9210) TaxID=578458 RepID=UPI002160AA20|nr:uncharacterized protein SCHCODRAFT_02603939 [Schizophyllum commune H4-8]KAI5899009.1 hypothetical protein SCHCODRAFT_02603939 [Schizophyllum commune H4-8]